MTYCGDMRFGWPLLDISCTPRICLVRGRGCDASSSTFRAFQARAGKPFQLIESCRQELQADPDCTGKVGVIGFCMGGGFALLLSAEGYDAASVNYGMVPSDIDELAARAWSHRGQLRRQGLDGQERACAARGSAHTRRTT